MENHALLAICMKLNCLYHSWRVQRLKVRYSIWLFLGAIFSSFKLLFQAFNNLFLYSVQPKGCCWCSYVQWVCVLLCILEFKRTSFTGCCWYKGIQYISILAFFFSIVKSFFLNLCLWWNASQNVVSAP